ncbi:MAG: SMI1/KNR4 family protein [Anaerolineales bacterium]|nr:SMI1/KNR4 family protein [Anaerolineales bacterium]
MNSLGLKIIQHLKNYWHESSFELFEYGSFPLECPWQIVQKQVQKDFIKNIFQPIAIPITLDRLIENCQSIYALLESNKWFLIYAIDEDTFLCGGEPTNTPILPVNVISDGWELPDDLRVFYSVHNGFGTLWSLEIFWSSHCILPDNKLDTLNSFFKDDPDFNFAIDPKYLLQFFPDGLGNQQCFYKLKTGELTTVDWDHETREIYHQENFWGFVDRRLFELI